MNRNSLYAQLDPRSKIIFSIFYISNVLMLQLDDIQQSIIVFVTVIIMIIFSGYSIKYYVRKILKIYPMIFFTTFLLPFINTNQIPSVDDTILIDVGLISVYKSGLVRFLNFNIKSILILSSTFVLTMTTPYNLLLKGMESIKVPEWLLSIVTYMFRLIYLLAAELEKIHMAFTSRHIALSYFARIKIFAKIIAVYFTRIIEHSERIYLAMISRGFSGQFPVHEELSWHLYDSLLVGGGIILTIMVIVWN